MGDGGAVLFDGYTVKDIDPVPLDAVPGRHTTTGALVLGHGAYQQATLGASRQWIVAITPMGAKAWQDTKVDGGSMTIFHFDDSGSTFLERTAELMNGNENDALDFTYDDVADFIYVGFQYPFSGFTFQLQPGGAANTNAANLTTEIWDGSAWVGIGHHDFTKGDDLKSFSEEGSITIQQDPFVDQVWTANTVNSKNRFWIRLSWNAALTQVQWATTQLIPWYPSILGRGIKDLTKWGNTGLLHWDGLDRGSVFPHLIMGRLNTNTGQATWHDMGHLPQDDYQLLIHGTTGEHSGNSDDGASGERGLTIIGRDNIVAVHLPANDRPKTLFSYPTREGLFEASAFRPAPGKLCKLKEIRIEGQGFSEEFWGQIFYSWDNKAWIPMSRFDRAPSVVVPPAEEAGGNLFRWAVAFKEIRNQEGQERHPEINHIEADFEILKERFGGLHERAPERNTASDAQEPPRF